VTSLTEGERVDWLRLARAEAVGPVTFRQLIARFGSAGAALDALPDLARRGGRNGALSIPTAADAERELAAGAAIGARMIAAVEPDFPLQLAALDAPPPLLWVLGEPALLMTRSIAVVGARVASAAGRRFARTLAMGLGEAGYVVASGMARGIDAAAHEGALTSGTVAVLGGGVDDVYPSENAGLYEVLKSKGAVISERRPGDKAREKDFVRRNRIISGLSLGVVVVEAELRSGSLTTARLAGEQGREVFAVPGSPLDPRARGTNDLIRQGAVLVEDVDDILRVLEGLPGLSEPERSGFERDAAGEDPETAAVIEVLAQMLSPTATPIDELARSVDAPLSTVLAALVELSLAGRATILPGGLVVGVYG
jgi:DNA processing protein